MSFLYLKFEKIVSLAFINCVIMSSKLLVLYLKFINYVIDFYKLCYFYT